MEDKKDNTAAYGFFYRIGILIVLYFFKKYEISIPIFGKELDFFGINWKVYMQRTWIWYTLSGIFILSAIGKCLSNYYDDRRKAE